LIVRAHFVADTRPPVIRGFGHEQRNCVCKAINHFSSRSLLHNLYIKGRYIGVTNALAYYAVSKLYSLIALLSKLI